MPAKSSKDKPKDNFTLDIARAYRNAGISVIPIKRDGSKAPACSAWLPYQTRLATDADLHKWFGGSKPAGIGTVGGAVSGGLEQMDFDTRAEELFAKFCELVEAEAPGLLAKICVVEMPRNPVGYHVVHAAAKPSSGRTPAGHGASVAMPAVSPAIASVPKAPSTSAARPASGLHIRSSSPSWTPSFISTSTCAPRGRMRSAPATSPRKMTA
jgi:hypothetical protein